ncbi:MAG: hypothetical protein KBA31_19060 [Alphaproteobacteria bacterium]|nr:hypothetical protein [Alphaproteobacteria bacterium]
MFEKLRTYQLASDLKGLRRHKSTALRERRKLFTIAVVDDNPFEPRSNLENVGYRIVTVGDPSDVEVLAPHQIILCDLQGVGLAFDKRKQGAFLIQEIKKHFPDKFVVAYSGGTKNLNITRDASKISDEFLKKDTDIETWVQTLDDFIARLMDPYAVWQRQREALVAREVDTLTILRLEDAFVRSVKSGDSSTASAFQRLIGSEQLGADVRAVLRSVVASGLFKIIVGS